MARPARRVPAEHALVLQFEQYSQEKIGPYTQQVGIPGPPRITFYDVHNYQSASVSTK